MSLKIVYRQNRMKMYTKTNQIAPLNKKIPILKKNIAHTTTRRSYQILATPLTTALPGFATANLLNDTSHNTKSSQYENVISKSDNTSHYKVLFKLL